MSSHPYMPLYVADYLADTAHLSTEESGAYLLLIMTYWRRGKPLPAESARLANIARLSNERWTDVERTLSEFFTVVDGEWRHKRIDAELAKADEKAEKARAAGKLSGKRRSEQKTNSEPTPVERTFNGRSTDAQRTPNYSDSESNSIKGDSARETKRCSPDGVTIADGRIALDGPNRAFWLEQFGDDGPRLDLALIQAAGYIQPHGGRPLFAQVGAQLARAAADRRDRDRRHATTVESNRRIPAKPGGAPASASRAQRARDLIATLNLGGAPS